MRKSSTGLTCFVPFLKVCPAFFLFFAPPPKSIVVGHPSSENSLSCLKGISFGQRTFSCEREATEFTLKAELIAERTLFLLALSSLAGSSGYSAARAAAFREGVGAFVGCLNANIPGVN